MEDKILEKMKEFQSILDYEFKDIHWLAKAMKSEKRQIPDKKKPEYSNESLATVGDSLLNLVIADYLYSEDDSIRKDKITEERKSYVNNKSMSKLIKEENWISYAYNDKYFYNESPREYKVVSKKHNAYLEAIVAAIYYDSNFDTAKDWIVNKLLPILEKYKIEGENK